MSQIRTSSNWPSAVAGGPKQVKSLAAASSGYLSRASFFEAPENPGDSSTRGTGQRGLLAFLLALFPDFEVFLTADVFLLPRDVFFLPISLAVTPLVVRAVLSNPQYRRLNSDRNIPGTAKYMIRFFLIERSQFHCNPIFSLIETPAT